MNSTNIPSINPPSELEEELFDTARKLATDAERLAYLEKACDGDTQLRRRLEAMLMAEADAEAFFSEGRSVVSATIGPLQLSMAQQSAAADGSVASLGEEPIGARIGRYKLLEKIG